MSSSVVPILANNADLFFDFSTKRRVGTTFAGGGNADEGTESSDPTNDVGASGSTTEATVTVTEYNQQLDGITPEVAAKILAELEEIFGGMEAEMEVETQFAEDGIFVEEYTWDTTTEALLGLSVEVPANATTAEWASAYGFLLSDEEESYYSAQGSGYVT